MTVRSVLSRPFVTDARLARAAHAACMAQRFFEETHPVEHDESLRLRALRDRVQQTLRFPIDQARLDAALAVASAEVG